MVERHPGSGLIGKFVHDAKFGTAKIVATEVGRYKLEYFFSPWNRKHGWTTSAKIEPVRLHTQTRVYVELDGRWRSGRIGLAHLRRDKGYDYEVEFPNKRVDIFPEEQVYCRCWSAHDDPTASLSAGGGETQYWHEHRQRLMAALIKQRAACRGQAAFLSSKIEFVPHQVEVARRVLEDPLQRYLLADEVGMGKTIEAGIIIRQFLLSNPRGGKVWVLVPERLIKQWERELVNKFGTDEYQGRVCVFDVDRPSRLPAEQPDFLVIDEAHHVVADEVPKALLALAIRTPRLLLLSATPALGRTDVLLRLLRIIDPDGYSTVEQKDFQRQVDKREEIGIFLRGLRADANPAVLRQRLRTLPALFAEDKAALAMGDEIANAVAASDVARVRQGIGALRSHIADVHQIHQRLVRTRRRDAADWVFRARGPAVSEGEEPDLSHVRLTWIEDSRLSSVVDLFEQWRMEVAVTSAADESLRKECTEVAAALFEAIGISVDYLHKVVEHAPESVLSAQWKATFKEIASEANDQASRADQVAADIRRYLEFLRAKLGTQRPRLVVFGTARDDVTRCASATAKAIGTSQVMVAAEFDGDADVSLEFFKDAAAQVLFCGNDEEEGLNLHFADAIMHLDLPLSPTRLEQRIGRVDRYGRRVDIIQQRVVLPEVPEEMSVWEAWHDVLSLGLLVFNTPITDVQFSLEEVNQYLINTLLEGGAQGVRSAIATVKARLHQEREKLDNQYALDKVLQEEAADRLFNNLEELEADEDDLEQATSGWLFRSLLFHCKGDPRKVFQIEWDSEQTLLPAAPWAQVFSAGLGGMHTFRRRHAVRGENGEHPQLLRIGSTLIRSLESEIKWDDRGTAFATWRHIPSLEHDLWICFKLCYVIEARLPEKLHPDERHAYGARVDGYLPPWMETIYLDSKLEVIADPALMQVLELPYEKGRDFNLGGKVDILDALIDQETLSQLCRQVREFSESWLRDKDTYKTIVRNAVENASLDVTRRVTRLEQLRKRFGDQNTQRDDELRREIEINTALPTILQNPHVKLDSIGLYVLSNRSSNQFLEGL